jgi:O-Antigen ligase
MDNLVLVPCLICLFLIMRGRMSSALLSVYLPTLFLLPVEYTIRIPHFPELGISQVCVIPLGIVGIIRLMQRGSLKLMDFLVTSFLVSLSITEVLREQVTKDGIFLAIISFISMLLPYAVGRTMIEPENRFITVRRIVLLALLLGVPGLFEWRMARNFYAPLGTFFGASLSPVIQLRGGHGRFSASFMDSELAGTGIAIAVVLNGWLAFLWRKKLWPNPDVPFAWLEKSHMAEILLLTYVLLTQSRGPQIALVAGYLILQIPRFNKTRVASVAVAILLAIGAAAAYQYFDHLTSVPDTNDVRDEQQGSALYRRRMIELFQPILEQGGWLGWGYKSFPHAQGLGNLDNGVQSVDNEFLYVYLGQGRLGFFLFFLIAVESLRTAMVSSWRLDGREDRAFAFAMLASLAVLWISLVTVYMGGQLPQIAFLLIGWGQSIVPGSKASVVLEEVSPPPQFSFRRVFS